MARLTIADLIRRDGREPGGGRANVPVTWMASHKWTPSLARAFSDMTPALVEMMLKDIKAKYPVDNFTLIGPWSRT